MTFLIESLIACAVFTLFVFLMSRDPVKTVFNYSPAIIERCKQLVFGLLLGLLVRYVNGCTTFWCGALTAYALWCVVNWFDAIVLDCIWFCHDPHFVIKGTEDMARDYHDYWFHIKGALIGMVLAVPAAMIAGLIVIL